MYQKVIGVYKTKVWKLIPTLWRYWWVKTLSTYCTTYIGILLDYPESIIVDKTLEVDKWNNDIKSMTLTQLASPCNKYMLPPVIFS